MWFAIPRAKPWAFKTSLTSLRQFERSTISPGTGPTTKSPNVEMETVAKVAAGKTVAVGAKNKNLAALPVNVNPFHTN